MTKSSKIKYGKKDLVGGPVKPSEESIRISVMMEGDLLDALKARAAQEKRPYQTIMKEMLRAQLENAELRAQIDPEEIKRLVEQFVGETLKKKKVG